LGTVVNVLPCNTLITVSPVINDRTNSPSLENTDNIINIFSPNKSVKPIHQDLTIINDCIIDITVVNSETTNTLGFTNMGKITEKDTGYL